MNAKTTFYAKWFVRLLIALAIGYLIWHYWPEKKVESVHAADGMQMKFRTNKDQIEIFNQQTWTPFFVKGVNLGAALPGYDPGDLVITKAQYLNWFKMIQDMGSNTIRVYTILKPEFYEALVEYNQRHSDAPLYFIQGVWSPEEELIDKKDAYDAGIFQKFQNEISDAVGAVYGSIKIPDQFGKASGTYKANAGPYLVGWHIGTEWDPTMVKNTNDTHKDKKNFKGTHISAKPEASPFENWLAEMLDHVAVSEAEFGWNHPLTFTNWVTTDPLTHPGEVLIAEDLVSVDATHLQVNNWAAGYFASFHAYPYYPDAFTMDETLKDVVGPDGKANSYKSYLRKLKAYHAGIPVMITEFGVPSSMGIAHKGSLDRNQGGHNEQEQGQIDVSLFNDIYSEGMAGAIVFSWQDEWFKRTWNTMNFDNSQQSRRKYWHNELTNEQHFGLMAELSSKDGPLIIDGDSRDWDALKNNDKKQMTANVPGYKEITMTHDEAYVYINAKLDQPFDSEREKLYIGVDTLPGGNKQAKELGGKTLDEGLETLIVLGKDGESEVRIASNYDMHTRFYGKQKGIFAVKPDDLKDNSGVFNPWKLAVGLEMQAPDSKKYVPFEEVPAGKLIRGTTNPDSPQYNSLAMWQAQGNNVEIRVPWMLLGFTDPSSLQVIGYGEKEDKLFSQATNGIRLVPWIEQRTDGQIIGLEGSSPYTVSQLPLYTWKPWNTVKYIERPKQSYKLMQQAFQAVDQPKVK
jgi:cbb3-type cytochrome oxidase subunit 3